MVRTASMMMPLGTKAPDFSLPSAGEEGRTVQLADFKDSKGLLVVFMCNHCPYVIHVADELKRLADDYADRGISVVGISSNDVSSHPDDSFEKMAAEKASRGYNFPYLYDETQEVAKAYSAACTPDFFLFDANRELFYRGQLDNSRPGQGIDPDGADLRAAIESLLQDKDAPDTQKPSIGCNIKWIDGNAPNYFNPSGIG
ncbi:thiol-disulfide oxidoreductase [Roseimaritima multifibrata]|uniref:Thiol-disulfide oxidoreductase n=1 Tax=Roseimaritima multifibrata TaxID=1930274 RepID=A0A517MBU5_9BACT|nr:thioredoxin family protein [Roseimaritima multifibrata]QDS92335.1 thiol-disulfide oxidoreductase [Roseimaritima multifibrata]